eukprot:Plantae.Rhodophyta-Hildenbrandia_rubra.ctg22235.p2 GENE.Plantae.Rhodophyta-Hildenbrandia_rubra.ctg22235~~Plantae.Rhodophyta-Hildenbrandia_rubra.ctg22235.p2  ORF type:complete len:401 (+),score=103.71 Plantae.Rhodophyta-Hildenbrandia_rubra.ctg22235:2920-4122(+)
MTTMEDAIKKRPMTRAWAALVASAEKDAEKAEQLRREADRYIRESDALARKRIARRKASTAQLTPKGSTWDPDWTSDDELKRFGSGEGLERVINDKGRLREEVLTLKKMLGGRLEEWKVKLAAFERFEVIVERVAGKLGNVDEVLEEIVELMGKEVVGLRGTLVKKAAEATAKAARLFSVEQTILLMDASLTARTKAKQVMTDAADHLARCLLRNATCVQVWEFVTDKVETASHPIQRKSSVDYISEIGLRHNIKTFDAIVHKAITSSMVDKSAMVREAGKALYAKYCEVSKSKAENMFQSFSEDVQSRLGPQGKEKNSSKGKRKARGISMKEVIREKRRQMQAAKAQGSKSSNDQPNIQRLTISVEDKENQAFGTNGNAGLAYSKSRKSIQCESGDVEM